MTPEKPMNVLLITSDQHRWDALGKENSVLKTPALDRLADEGILFNKAYTCNPVCTPARVSVLTGQYPSRHGCYTIGTNLPFEYPTAPQAMSRAGFFTSLIGKAHFQACCNEPIGDPDSFEAPPKIFDLDYFDQWTGPYFGFDYVQLAIDHSNHENSPSMHYGAWLRKQGVESSKYFGTGAYTDWGKWDLPEEYHNSRWTADETITAIDKGRESGRPFFIWSSFQDPHNPCVAPEPWCDMYDPADMPEYAYQEGEYEGKPPFYKGAYEGEGKLYDEELDGEKNWYCFKGLKIMTPEATRQLAAVYFGMVSLMDHHIGRIIKYLEDQELLDSTIIVFTTDHGDYLGNHGIWWKGLPTFDDAQRIPFLVRHPDCQTPGSRSEAFQSLVDIAQTAMTAMGMEPPALMQGVNQLDAWKNSAAQARDWAMCEYRPTEGPFMQKTFVHGKWKLALYHDRDYGELYDMEADPDQYKNLWDDPDYAEKRSELIQKFVSAEMEKDGVLRPRVAWA
ncbi:MAG: sulfatase-like hydrolase/transferase [bacterium]